MKNIPIFGAVFVGVVVGSLSPHHFTIKTEEVVATEIKEVEKIVEVDMPADKKYRECVSLARSLQNPDFWTGELQDAKNTDEVVKIIDHCIKNGA